MGQQKPLYFDYNATALIRPAVTDLMRDIMARPGNASAAHGFGRLARACVEKAREQVAALCAVHSNQVVFNSGATEANNTVLKAFAGGRILVSAIEHASMLEFDANAERIPVMPDGTIDMAAFEKMLDDGPAPALISVMMVNNETGAMQPVEQLARFAKKKFPSVFFHTDAVQAAGKMKIDMPALQIDYLSLSAHKIGGPQGVGALVVSPGARPAKLLYGSGQERRQRAGTENVAGIAGFGLAAEMAGGSIAEYANLAAWRNRLERGMKGIAPDLVIYSENAPRAANVTAFSIPGVAAQTILMGLDLEGIGVSRGTACGSGAVKPSHVIQAMAGADAPPDGALRISLGWGTREEEIDIFLSAFEKVASRADGRNAKKEEAAHA
ncbi:MAG: cysteine desulfurase [Proteobacteria bacterium]|nr:cysteine desulfurase [Pseudomonadota bacterium]